MNANQSGMNDTPRVDAKASTPSLVSIKSLSPLPVIPGLLLATTGLFAPTGLLAEEIRWPQSVLRTNSKRQRH